MPGLPGGRRTPAALIAFGDQTGWPVIAKTSRGGYDGKGVWKLDRPADAEQPFANLTAGVAMIAEEFIAFRRELSALVVRSPSGQAVAYPVSESVQRNGVCVETTTPAPGLDDDADGRRSSGWPSASPTSSASSDCSRWS